MFSLMNSTSEGRFVEIKVWLSLGFFLPKRKFSFPARIYDPPLWVGPAAPPQLADESAHKEAFRMSP
jgi:hypothetical protein